MSRWILATVLIMAATLASRQVQAFEAADNDAFYLGLGSANIEIRNSDDLLSGSNLFGGVRLGLFSTFFWELGYGTVGYADTVEIGGVLQDVDVRTTGAHVGFGLLIPIRNVRLGTKIQRSPNNKWVEEIKDSSTGVTNSNISGDIDFDSYYVFVQFGETGGFEVGVRRDRIDSFDTVLENSFGPYLTVNISLK